MSPEISRTPNDSAITAHDEQQNIGKRIGGNAVWLFTGHLGSMGFMVVFTILVARRLGHEGLGQYAYVASIIFMFNVFSTFGTDLFLIREIAAKKDFSLLGSSLAIQLALSSILVVITYIVTTPNEANQVVQALQIYSLVLFPMSFYTIFSTALRGSEKMHVFTLLNLITGITQVTLVWFFIQPSASIINLAWLLLVTQTFVAVLAGIVSLRIIPAIRHNWINSRGGIIYLCRATFLIFGLTLLKVVYQRITVYMLYVMEGSSSTGLFSAAKRVVDASELGHVALLGALFPVMARSHFINGPNSQARGRIFLHSWRLLLILGILITMTLYSFASPIIILLYGSKFGPAIGSLQILSLAVVPYSVNIYLSSRLLSIKREREVAFALIVSLFVMIGLNLLWIPSFGLVGASFGILLSEISQAGIYLFIRGLYSKRLGKSLGKTNPL